ncbi:unnamed protein product [Pedinophyceae sp. YPF-701]|nr:unnamed protein product [Pedinophyceae sp. YPF-701]
MMLGNVRRCAGAACRKVFGAGAGTESGTHVRSFGKKADPWGWGLPEGFFAEGTQSRGAGGFKYGETPPAPGIPRKWETWEAPYYFAVFGSLFAVAWVHFVEYDPENNPNHTTMSKYAAKEANRRITELREQGLTPEDTGMYHQFPFARRRREIMEAKAAAEAEDE